MKDTEKKYKENENYKKWKKIQEYKKELAALDYKTLKFIDGDISAEEYEPFKKRRAELRALIREKEIKGAK